LWKNLGAKLNFRAQYYYYYYYFIRTHGTCIQAYMRKYSKHAIETTKLI